MNEINHIKTHLTVEKDLYSDMGSRKLTKKEIERIQQPPHRNSNQNQI